jgi:hypothetical protein
VLTTTLFEVDFAEVIFRGSLDRGLAFLSSWMVVPYILRYLFYFLFFEVS